MVAYIFSSDDTMAIGVMQHDLNIIDMHCKPVAWYCTCSFMMMNGNVIITYQIFTTMQTLIAVGIDNNINIEKQKVRIPCIASNAYDHVFIVIKGRPYVNMIPDKTDICVKCQPNHCCLISDICSNRNDSFDHHIDTQSSYNPTLKVFGMK